MCPGSWEEGLGLRAQPRLPGCKACALSLGCGPSCEGREQEAPARLGMGAVGAPKQKGRPSWELT